MNFLLFENIASTDDSTVLTTLGGSSQDSVTQLNGSNTVTSTTTQQSDENSRFGHFEHSNEGLVQLVSANGNNKNGWFNRKIQLISFHHGNMVEWHLFNINEKLMVDILNFSRNECD